MPTAIDTTLLYGVDDLDPMDAQALLTPDAIEREMGRPLAQVPDPVGDCHSSYARHFASQFIDTFAGLGINPDRYYWMSDIYPTGALDPYIRLALDRAAVVRDIYRRVANVQHPDTWHPIGVICPTCGKVGTTIVTAWNGEQVFFECRPDLVTWARGCGTSGWISPFGGAAKLPWNLEWAAQWSLFGVTIEPNGKDLSTAGGSRDRSDAIAREVFEREPPMNVPYEFLNIGGKKMSTSKGRGAAAHTIAEVVPPEQLRFLFLRPRPNQVIEFDPDGTDAVPRLFDEFDRFAAATAGREVKGEIPPGYEATFRYALLDPKADVEAEAWAFRPAFAHLALLAQVPGVDLAARIEAEKGTAVDRARAGHPRRARRGLASLARGVRAGGRSRRRPARRRSLPRRPTSTTRSAGSWTRCRAPPSVRRRPVATPGRRSSSTLPRTTTCPRVARSRRSTLRSLAGRTGRARAGCWPASSRRSSSSGPVPPPRRRAERRHERRTAAAPR